MARAQDGAPKPEPMIFTQLRVPASLRDAVKAKAQQDGTTLADVTRSAWTAYVAGEPWTPPTAPAQGVERG